jgi:predicted amidohydrolase YtcJ
VNLHDDWLVGDTHGLVISQPGLQMMKSGKRTMSSGEAFLSLQNNGARATYDGDVKGSIKEGKLADLVILDRNIFDRPPEELLMMEVDMTMVDGKIVFLR